MTRKKFLSLDGVINFSKVILFFKIVRQRKICTIKSLNCGFIIRLEKQNKIFNTLNMNKFFHILKKREP